MLHEFLSDNRAELVARCRSKVILRRPTESAEKDFKHGIHTFLDQLIKTLEVEQSSVPMESRRVSGLAGGSDSSSSEIGQTAASHGRELLLHGYTIEQVVHDYGDLCQAVTDLAIDVEEPISPDEFRTMNRCLDNGIADAVTEFTSGRDANVAGRHTENVRELLGEFAHEARNFIQNAMLALEVVKTGKVGITGATGGILERSLRGLNNLIDRSLAQVRVEAGLAVQTQLYPLNKFIAEVKLSAMLEAELRKCTLNVSFVDTELAVNVDRDLLFSAIGNLLQNALKFSHPNTVVTLDCYGSKDRIYIAVRDSCGGLPPGDTEKMFQSFTQNHDDKTGLGLGLSISRKSIEANQGVLSVRDIPGTGCVFTIDLPRHSISDISTVSSELIN